MAETKDAAFKIQLAKAVAKYPCLYDYNLKEYGKHRPTKLSWKKIAKKVNDTPMNCKEIWKSMKTGYMFYVAGQSEIVEVYYDKMQFIRPYLNLDTEIGNSMPRNYPSPTNDRNKAREMIVLSDTWEDSFIDMTVNENNSSEMDTQTTDDDDDESVRLLMLQVSSYIILIRNYNAIKKLPMKVIFRLVDFIDDLKNNNVDYAVHESKVDAIEAIFPAPEILQRLQL